MRKIVFYCSMLLLIPLVASKAGAQETSGKQPATAAQAQPIHYYHFDFTIENLDAAGKVTNSRSYNTTVDTEPHEFSSVRTNSKIPIVIGSPANEAGKSATAEFQYVDLGVDFDIRDVHEVGQQLAFRLNGNLSGEASAAPAAGMDPGHPVTRTNTWLSQVLVPIGKRTVVFTSDSLDSKGSTRVVVTALPIEE